MTVSATFKKKIPPNSCFLTNKTPQTQSICSNTARLLVLHNHCRYLGNFFSPYASAVFILDQTPPLYIIKPPQALNLYNMKMSKGLIFCINGTKTNMSLSVWLSLYYIYQLPLRGLDQSTSGSVLKSVPLCLVIIKLTVMLMTPLEKNRS